MNLPRSTNSISGSAATESASRYVITGASGFVASLIIPRLIAGGCELLLVGRDATALRRQYPGLPCARYADWTLRAEGFDAVVNLAIINNSKVADWQSTEQVNVALPVDLATQAQAAGIAHFVQCSSVHALDPANKSPYARSKRAADAALRKINGVQVHTLYLGAVWGECWSGALKHLNRLPGALTRVLFRPVAALKATTHCDRLCAALRDVSSRPRPSQVITDDQDANPWYRGVSALIDYGFAIGIIATLWWLLLLIAIAVRMTSPGPGVFSQRRVGQHGRIFTCYKFRTMQSGTPQTGTHEVSAASVTRIGAFLRKTKLDELPQVWNILRGDLRLVGPRPGLPVQEELTAARQQQDVFRIKPGITGWAQIHGIDMSEPATLARWDAHYTGMRGLLLDLRIILATAFGRGQGDRVAEGHA